MTLKKIFSVMSAAIIFFVSSQTFAEEKNSEPEDKNFDAKKISVDEAIQQTVKKLEDKKNFISLEARYFSLGADANLNTSKVNLDGGELNLKKDLNLIDNKAAEIIFRYKNFSVDYLRMNHHGGGNFSDNNLNFGGKNFSDNVSAKNNLHYIKLNVDNEIISLMGTGAFWTYGVTGIYYDGKVNSASQSYFVPVPTVGLGLYMAIMPKMTIYTQISGIFLGGKGSLRDFESGLKYSPSKNFSMTAGFRSIEFNFNHKGNGDFKMNGPFIGLRTDF